MKNIVATIINKNSLKCLGENMAKCDEKGCNEEATNFINEEPQKKGDNGQHKFCDVQYGKRIGIPALKEQSKFQPPTWGRYSGQVPIG